MKKIFPNQEVNNKRSSLRIIFISFLIIFAARVYAQSDTIQTNVKALKNVYANDFYIGCLLSYRNIGFTTDPPVTGQSAVVTPNGGYLIKYHMNSMSPGNNMKPQYTVDMNASAAAYNSASASAKDSVDIHPVVRFNGDIIAQLNWAKRQGFTFRGHTLVWHSQTPGVGFFCSGYTSSGTRLSKEKMTQRLENYIKEVIRIIHERWPGLLSAMDVVNEAVNDNGTDRTAGNEWFTTFGDNSFIMKAFEFAREYSIQYGESQIKLYYNDYSTHLAAKADGIVRVCTPIFQAGYLDGIGMQEHDLNSSPTAAQWIATYNKFEPICTEMAITELDVYAGSANPSSSALTTQANQYGQLFKCFVERSYFSGRGKIISVSKDGLNDQYTFSQHPASSLWDAQNKCKPAFFSVVDVGINYNALDSLISYANTLIENEYTTASWANFTTALTLANNAKVQNYSATISAATELGDSKNNLKTAIDGLIRITTDINLTDENIPKTFSLNQNYPNPFNPETVISYQLTFDSKVSLKVYDLLGREITTLVNEYQRAGIHNSQFSIYNLPAGRQGSQLTSGVYLYSLRVNNYVATKKFVLMK